MSSDPSVLVATRLDRLKRQLIDLTRRNRLLNYRPTKASTVEIVDELPQQVLRQLLDGVIFELDPIPERGDREDSQTDPFVPQRSYRSGTALRRTTGRELATHHTDDRLQTKHERKRLEKNLLRIYRLAESSLEEQGVNTLFMALGMLEWYESADSDIVNRAPVLMVPVTLMRRDASSPFRLRLGDDDPVINPAIVEKLRLDFGVEFPTLPELSEDIDVDDIFMGIGEAVAGFGRWRVTNDIALSLFSFLKFVMYRDLEKNSERFKQHRVFRRMCGVLEEGDLTHSGLPAEVLEADLDVEMSPWRCPQVLDADSSQQRAILAVRQGQDLVIEGPPGTGKSQTITNLIAQALHDGQSVLFVSEKMAALEVVKTRLESVGLGDFCLELHSHKTAKTAFVRELARCLEMPSVPSDRDGDAEGRHRLLTSDLHDYVTALHKPFGALGFSPFAAIARLTELQDAPLIRADIGGLLEATRQDFDRALENLRDLGVTLRDVGDPVEHPLRGLGIARLSVVLRDDIEDATSAASAGLLALIDEASGFAEFAGLAGPTTFGDVDLCMEAARVIGDSPGADESVLTNEAWNEVSSDVEALIAAGEKFSTLREHVRRCFEPEVLEADLSSNVREFAGHVEHSLRYFKPSYWKCRAKLRSFRLPDYKPEGDKGLLTDHRRAQECRELLAHIGSSEEAGRTLFGRRWKREDSDWAELRSFSAWVVELRRYALKEVLDATGFSLAADAALEEADVRRRQDGLAAALELARGRISELVQLATIENDSDIIPAIDRSMPALLERLREVRTGLTDLWSWAAYQEALTACDTDLLSDFLGRALGEESARRELDRSFERAFLRRWLDAAVDERRPLRGFRSTRHEERISEFQELDRVSQTKSRETVRRAVLSMRQRLLRSELASQLQIVQREARKRRRIRPVRQLLALTPGVITTIKPCFMMSPLSAAQYLDPEKITFDLLVFDEASQITPPDAIGSLIRAKRVVVVGDSKQLPPTNFFASQVDSPEDLDSEVEEELLILDDLESILDEAAASGVPSLRLKWHYRSQHESLIRFSNEEFYSDDPLYTFPSAAPKSDHLGLQFEWVEDGVYEGGGVNTVEARRVACAVAEHIKDSPNLTLGVGTFGMKQQTRILDELEVIRRRDPSLEFFFAQEGEQKFFVKNLENIQGDDRDVIFISVTYGPDASGRVRRNFGPINGQNGWRRLNVITTRAKQRLRVFSSMRADDIDRSGQVAQGVRYLQRFLKYAESGQYPTHRVTAFTTLSPLEEAVIEALRGEGYEVVPQVGEAGYRIDIGILDPESPGRFVCGIECDGASYHSALTVRDRDRLRQQVLEDRGWIIHRVWSTDWFHDRARQIDRLKELIEQSRKESRRRAEQPPPEDTVEPAVELDGGSAYVTGPEAPPTDVYEENEMEVAEIPVKPYEFAEPDRIRPSEQFYTCGVRELDRITEHVVSVEGPIHEEELARRVGAFFGMRRAGGRIRTGVDTSVGRLVRSKTVKRAGAFIWPAAMERPSVRSRDIDGVIFKPEHISSEEAREAVLLLLQHRAPLLPDQVVAETARLLGFRRTGHKLSALTQGALASLVAEERLAPGAYGLRLADSHSAETRQSLDERVFQKRTQEPPQGDRDWQTIGLEVDPSAERPKPAGDASDEKGAAASQPKSERASVDSKSRRPYFKTSVFDLESLVSKSTHDRATLKAIRDELERRITHRAQCLLSEIEALLRPH